ncbi:hypothetical protein Tco_0152557 [Tanacetum coccineum]
MVDEEKEFDEERLSTEDGVSTVKEGVSTDFKKVSTDSPKVSTDESKVSTDEQEQVKGTEESNESTEEIFEGTGEQREGTEDKVSTDDQMEGMKINTKEKLLLKLSNFLSNTHFYKFGDDENNYKGKKKIEEEEESESEDDNIPQAVKKFKQLESDEELARKIQESGKRRRKETRLAEEKNKHQMKLLLKTLMILRQVLRQTGILAEEAS